MQEKQGLGKDYILYDTNEELEKIKNFKCTRSSLVVT